MEDSIYEKRSCHLKIKIDGVTVSNAYAFLHFRRVRKYFREDIVHFDPFIFLHILIAL